MIFMILIGATVFGYYMTLSRIPQEVVTVVIAMDLNRWVVLIGIVVAYFVISMFMDEIPLLLLTLQLTFPLVTSLGFDPVWFGVVVDDDGGDGPRLSAGRPARLRGQRDGGRRSDEGLQGHQHPHAGAGRDHRAADDLPGYRALAAAHDAVIRFTASAIP